MDLSVALSVGAAMFAAELGDKTQLFVMGLAAKERIRDVIIGVVCATLLINLMGVYIGVMLAGFIRTEMINLAAGFFFLMFACMTTESDEKVKMTRKFTKIAAIAIGIMFFVAELGDKTQLAAIAFAAENPAFRTSVFIGSCLGMLMADGAGLFIGIVLGKSIPQKVFSRIAFLLFTVFGFHSIYESCIALSPQNAGFVVGFVAFAYALIFLFPRLVRRKKTA